MLETFNTLKGSFKIECIKDNQVIDSYEDHNFIMTPARRTVAEMFSNALNTGLNKLVLGTAGGTSTPWIPVTEKDFSKARTHLYSEFTKQTTGSSVFLYKLEIIKVNGLYYRYLGSPETILISTSNLNNPNLFEIVEAPYVYNFGINPSSSPKVPDGTTNYASVSGNECKILLEDTSVIFSFILATTEGNGQYNADTSSYGARCSFFNEAGMYFNNKLFCSKCFIPKVKDEATSIRLTWKIIF